MEAVRTSICTVVCDKYAMYAIHRPLEYESTGYSIILVLNSHVQIDYRYNKSMASSHARLEHEVLAHEPHRAEKDNYRMSTAEHAFQADLEEAGIAEHVAGLLLRHADLQQGARSMGCMQIVREQAEMTDKLEKPLLRD